MMQNDCMGHGESNQFQKDRCLLLKWTNCYLDRLSLALNETKTFSKIMNHLKELKNELILVQIPTFKEKNPHNCYVIFQ